MLSKLFLSMFFHQFINFLVHHTKFNQIASRDFCQSQQLSQMAQLVLELPCLILLFSKVSLRLKRVNFVVV
jgi:hypothetical protein